jgi:hypothetical protein
MKRIVLRVFAVLLSLASPGCGHFLIGTFRRGVAWVVGSTVLGMTMMFLGVLLFSRYRFPSMLIAVLVGILLVRIVAAIDTVSLTPQKHSWKMFVLAWATLLSSAGLFDFLVTPYYIAHFVLATTRFTTPGPRSRET